MKQGYIKDGNYNNLPTTDKNQKQLFGYENLVFVSSLCAGLIRDSTLTKA